jgi:hypothetical protein
VDGDALNALRDRLREELPRAGLAGTLDRRYRISTAHSTFLRFRSVPDRLPELVRGLEAARTREFGAFTVDHLDFVINDWYMSHNKGSIIERYTLRGC